MPEHSLLSGFKQNSLPVTAISIVLLLGITIAIYAPGLHGPFLFDDEGNITRNDPVLISEITPETLYQAAFSTPAGPLKRPISYVSFAINHVFTGLDPFYFKLTNLAIHLLCGLLIYLLSRQLLWGLGKVHGPSLSDERRHWVSLLASALWLLHPLNLTTVLYIVQRMTSLSTLFVLLGLLGYCWARNRQLQGRPGTLALIASISVFTPLAAFSKEIGALLPFLMFTLELTLYRFSCTNRTEKQRLLIFFAVVAVFPAVLAAGYLISHIDNIATGYATRDFTLGERLLTQARAIWFYIFMGITPSISQLGLFHDDFIISRGFFTPISTGLAIVGIIGLLAAVWLLRKRAPLVSLGLLFFLVGHSMESSVFALEMVHEHRNYLPIYGIILPLAYYVTQPGFLPNIRFAGAGLGVLLMIFFAVSTHIRANYWSDPIQLAVVETQNHPNSARNQYQLGLTYWRLMELQPEKEGHYAQLARQRFSLAKSASSYNHSGLFALIMLDANRGNPVDSALVSELATRLQNSPFANASIGLLHDLGRCQLEGPCQLSPKQINAIFDAALNNRTLRGSSRSKVLADAMIQAMAQGDFDKGLKLGQQAVEKNPSDPQLKLNLSSVLIQAGRLSEAEALLQELSRTGVTPFYQHRLTVQFQALEEAKAKTPMAPPVNPSKKQESGDPA